MIYIIDAENRALFDADLSIMHRHRKTTFVYGLRWPLPIIAGEERDAYDRDDTRYLIARERGTRPLRASARLLPTTAPHLMGDLFAHTCPGGPPAGDTVWEASRFCTAPQLARRQRLNLLWQVFCGILETALLHDIEQVTFTADRALLPLALGAGWRARTLGPSFADGSAALTAVGVEVDLPGLRTLRQRFAIAGPITRLVSPARLAA